MMTTLDGTAEALATQRNPRPAAIRCARSHLRDRKLAGMRLSPNFTLAQLTHSDTALARGIVNQPDQWQIDGLMRLAQTLELVMALLRAPLSISSAYRCPELNAAVGGAPESRHALGLAVDFTCPQFGTSLAAARAIADSALEFDQLIHEYGRWVHLGLAPAATVPRRQTLTICSARHGYVDGLSDCTLEH